MIEVKIGGMGVSTSRTVADVPVVVLCGSVEMITGGGAADAAAVMRSLPGKALSCWHLKTVRARRTYGELEFPTNV